MNLRTKKFDEALYKHFRRHEHIVLDILNNREVCIRDLAKRHKVSMRTVMTILGRMKKVGIIRDMSIKIR